MPSPLDSRIQRRLRDRQALLWVCQPYDLQAGEHPHELDLPADAAQTRYRAAPTDADRGLAGLYWEAVWLEGANSPILKALKAVRDEGAEQARPQVVLSGADEATASFAEHQFQPVCVLPGRLDLGPDAATGLRYAGVKPRQRQKIAESMAQRLIRYPQRVLVVLGAASSSDLNRYLYPTLEDNPIIDLDLVVVYPPDLPPPPAPDNPAVRFFPWPGSPGELLAALRDIGTPTAEKPVGWTVRVKYPGKEKTVGLRLAPDTVQRVLEQFELLTEDDLRLPNQFSLEDLTVFLDGTPGAWAGYASGLPVPRSYRTVDDRTLAEELVRALAQVETTDPTSGGDQTLRRRSATLTLPCREGSGATTLLRASAFAAAQRGYPTLVLRPGVAEIDLEMLAAFATGLTETAFANGFEGVPPLAVVLDVETADFRSARKLAGTMTAQGRPVVVLRGIPAKDDLPSGDSPTTSTGHLPSLETKTDQTEVAACEQVFHKLVTQWKLPLTPLPTLADWVAYESRTRWRTLGAGGDSHSMFWVALRFFLISGLSRTDEETVQNALGRWIRERADRLTDPQMRKVLTWVAALSSQRIVCPLGIALRPVTGGGFSSAMVPAMKEMAALVEWQEFSRDLEDYTLRFRHPALAEEFLRQHVGEARPDMAVRELEPLLRQLVPGRPADRWLVEQLVTQVLTPTYHERQRTDWEWRLVAFDTLPSALAAGSGFVLHHWARCLYQSADARNSPEMPLVERRRRLDLAVRYLQDAIALPRQMAREEHPSHLWNTLGVAYARRAKLLEDSDSVTSQADWAQSWEAFRNSIDLLPGNIEALLAFSRRLLEHAGEMTGPPVSEPSRAAVDDVANALGLLDEANELLDQDQDPDPDVRADLENHRTRALAWLGGERIETHLAALRSSAEPELGYYCQAQLVAARNPTDEDTIQQALDILDTSAGIKPLSARAIRLQVSLLRRHSIYKFDFSRLLGAHEALERAAENKLHPIEQFRLAVLYFQVGEFRKGDERFRKLRELERRTDVSVPVIQDVWRQLRNPMRPRLTRARVSRMTNEWRAEGYVDELNLTIPLRPRHFSPLPKLNDVVECGIRFEFRGPLVVPKRFVSPSDHRPTTDGSHRQGQ